MSLPELYALPEKKVQIFLEIMNIETQFENRQIAQQKNAYKPRRR